MPFNIAAVELTNPASQFLIGCLLAAWLAAGITTAMKGKWGCLIAGFFVAIVWVVSACRLAKPDSFWAREFYTDEGRDLAASRFGGPPAGARRSHQPA